MLGIPQRLMLVGDCRIGAGKNLSQQTSPKNVTDYSIPNAIETISLPSTAPDALGHPFFQNFGERKQEALSCRHWPLQDTRRDAPSYTPQSNRQGPSLVLQRNDVDRKPTSGPTLR